MLIKFGAFLFVFVINEDSVRYYKIKTEYIHKYLLNKWLMIVHVFLLVILQCNVIRKILIFSISLLLSQIVNHSVKTMQEGHTLKIKLFPLLIKFREVNTLFKKLLFLHVSDNLWRAQLHMYNIMLYVYPSHFSKHLIMICSLWKLNFQKNYHTHFHDFSTHDKKFCRRFEKIATVNIFFVRTLRNASSHADSPHAR